MARRGSRVVPVLLVVCAALVAGVMALGLSAAGSTGDESHAFSPSDDHNFNTYLLVNDAKRPVTVYICADATCNDLHPRSSWIPVQPGDSVTQQLYWNPGVKYGFLVAVSPHGRRCLVINADNRASGKVEIPLSTATSCADTPPAA